MKEKTLELEAAAVLQGVQAYTELSTVEEYSSAAWMLIQVKQRLSILDEKKRSLTAPAREVIKNAGEMFGTAVNDYLAIESRLKALLGAFADNRLPDAMRAAKAALNAGDRDALMTAMKPIPSVPGISLRTVVGFEVTGEVDESYYLPRELNSKLILTQLRNGVVIEGVRMTERTQVAVSIDG